MKNAFLLNFLLLIFAYPVFGQNPIPNSDFNSHKTFNGPTTIDDVRFWRSTGKSTPDYHFKEDNGFLSFYIYHEHDNMREYLQVKLNYPLPDTCRYVLKMDLRVAYNSRYSIGSIQAFFSKHPPKQSGRNLIQPYYQADLENELMQVKNNQWFVVRDTFEISGGEKYLTIGNFKSDIFSEVKEFENLNPMRVLNVAYYYIDNIYLESIPFPVNPVDSALATYHFALDSSFSLLSDTSVYVYRQIDTTLTTENTDPDTVFDKEKEEVELEEAEIGDKIILRNIRFEFNSSDLRESSKPVLNKVAELFEKEEDLKIKIVGHTDNVGDRETNLKLSKERARVVKEFLYGKGVSENRLLTEGKGSNDPITSNETEEDRTKNRRVEFIILQR